MQGQAVQGEVVNPQYTKAGPETIQQANADQIVKSAQNIGTKADYYALRGLLPAVPASILTTVLGHPFAALVELGTPVGIHMSGKLMSAVLGHPDIINLLSNPTAAQLEQLNRLPPAQRTAMAQNLKPLIEAAQRKNVQVSPAITALMGTSQPVANQFPAAHQLSQSQQK